MRFHCSVDVTLRAGLLDPQGKAVEGSLPALGWSNVSNVRVGKHIELDIDADDEPSARAELDEMAVRLLSNPVIESYTIRSVATSGTLAFEDRR